MLSKLKNWFRKDDWPSDPSKYQLGPSLASSSTGITLKCWLLNNPEKQLAIKIFSNLHKPYNLIKANNEEMLVQIFNNDNIIKLYKSIHAGDNVWILMEYVDIYGTLKDLIPLQWLQFKDDRKDMYRGLKQPIIANILKQIVEGLNYMHEKDYIYRNLKLDNILITSNGVIKLSNFGLAIKCTEKVLGPLTGPIPYLSPETVHKNEYSKKSDVWALGLISLELASFKTTFATHNTSNLKALFSKLRTPPSLFTFGYYNYDVYTNDYHSFVSKCLALNPEDRTCTAELLNHPLLLNVKSSQCLVKTFGLIRGGSAAVIHEENLKKSKFGILDYSSDSSSEEFFML